MYTFRRKYRPNIRVVMSAAMEPTIRFGKVSLKVIRNQNSNDNKNMVMVRISEVQYV